MDQTPPLDVRRRAELVDVAQALFRQKTSRVQMDALPAKHLLHPSYSHEVLQVRALPNRLSRKLGRTPALTADRAGQARRGGDPEVVARLPAVRR